MNKIMALLFALIIVSSSIVAIGVNGSTENYGPVTITGPARVAVGSNFTYTVNVQHYFTQYEVDMILSGYNLTGASPIYPQYINGTFEPINFTILAPTAPTTLFLFFQIKAYLNSQLFYYNYTIDVSVVNYTLLKAVVMNPSHFNVDYLNVSFFVNGNYVGSKIVNITQNSTETVIYKWLSGSLSSGVYKVTFIINSSIIKLANGSSYSFQVQSGNPDLIYIYLGIAAFFAIIIVVLIIGSYYARKRRPKWKK